MSLTREDMLRELELLPAWRLNAPLPQAEVTQAISAPEVATSIQTAPEPILQAIAEPIIQEPQIEQAQVEKTPDVANMDLATLNQYVMGSGDAKAEWLFIADAPSTDDLQAGHPFAGQAGQLLDKMLIAIQLQRSKNVFLTYLSQAEYLNRQIELIQPKLIFAFGEIAAQTLTQSKASLDELRGKVHDYQGVALVVSYPPAHLLTHTQDKAKAWADLCLAKTTLSNLANA
jgi:uracil-DNA glycosylase